MFRHHKSSLYNYIYSTSFWCYCLLLLLVTNSCGRTTANLNLLSQKTYDKIPSGSGITIHNNTAYIIGDDATNVFLLELKSGKQSKIPIARLNTLIYREEKPVKHDFESAVIADWKGQNYLLAIGSGSKAIVRDSMMLLNIANPADCKLFSLTQLYHYLQTKTNIPANQWNIEGATIVDGKLILANRGTNTLISIELNAFLSWVQTPTTDFPNVGTCTLQLPSIQNKEARLSGLCTISDTEIMFCASVENTPDWITDGPVLGSFIGSYSLSRKAVTSVHLLQNKVGEPIVEKIESLDILSNNSKTIKVMAIADNDNGSSKIFNVQIAIAVR
jgi:hypothetical protein